MTDNLENGKLSERPLYSVRFLDPQKIVADLEIEPGIKIAHFGSSNGYFTIPLAEKIGKNGTVYALDILEQKIDFLRGKVKALGLSDRIILDRVNLEEKSGSRLKDTSVDWVIIVNMLYQNSKKSQVIGEAKRILKDDGKILIIEWNDSNNHIGPQNQSRVSENEIIRIARKHDLGIVKKIPVSNFHFGLILKK
jgi:ubiquinone/menaquinone biosynthesis C-methylase UbiE